MTIFRNIHNKELYFIEHLINDIRHLNRNGNAGIYASGFFNNAEPIQYKSQNHKNCNDFVSNNFKPVYHT